MTLTSAFDSIKKYQFSLESWPWKDIWKFHFPDEELYGYTNYAMDTPTPSGPAGDCLPGLFQRMDSLSPGMDSEFDECLAVPESLSVMDPDKVDNKENDSLLGVYDFIITVQYR